MIDKEKLKNALSEEQVVDLVTYLGSDPPRRDNKNNLIFQTICHNRSGGSYKLYYYHNSKLFACYTECATSFDIFELIQKVNGIPFAEAVMFVQQFTGIKIISTLPAADRIQDWDFINKYVSTNHKKDVELPQYNPFLLEIFPEKYHVSWLKEGINRESMKKFNIRFDFHSNRIIIPHYDVNNHLVGIRCRNLNEEEVAKGMKYMPVKIENVIYSHPLSYNLYGLSHNLSNIRKRRKILIFEGEKSVLKLESFYPEHNIGVAVCGDKISEHQKKMIIQHTDEIIIGFDKGEKYVVGNKHESIIRVRNIAKTFAPYLRTYILVDKKNLLEIKDAPVDQGKDVFESLMRNKIEIRTFLSD